MADGSGTQRQAIDCCPVRWGEHWIRPTAPESRGNPRDFPSDVQSPRSELTNIDESYPALFPYFYPFFPPLKCGPTWCTSLSTTRRAAFLANEITGLVGQAAKVPLAPSSLRPLANTKSLAFTDQFRSSGRIFSLYLYIS